MIAGLALVSAKVAIDSIWEPWPHVAQPTLVGRVRRLLERSELLPHLDQIDARAATVDEVTRVNTQEHVAHLRRVRGQGGGQGGDFAPASPDTYAVALLAAGGALAAARIDGASELRIWAQIVMPTRPRRARHLHLHLPVGQLLLAADHRQQRRAAHVTARSGPLRRAQPHRLGPAHGRLRRGHPPLLIVFLIFQRHFVRGIAMSELK